MKMYEASLDVVEFDKWNKKIFKVYWCITALAFITEALVFFINPYRRLFGDKQYIWLFIVKPSGFNVLILLLSQWIHSQIRNKKKELVKYQVLITGTLLVSSMVYVHNAVIAVHAMFCLPIFLSQFYERKKFTYFAAMINLVSYIAFVFFYLPTTSTYNADEYIMNFFANIAIILVTLMIVLASMTRAKEIMRSLISTHKNEQKLALKNFVMEFNSKMEPATGLYNHKTFYEYLHYLIEQSESYKFPLSLAVFDIDNFKRINDTYGHSLGDEVIKALAEIIKGSISSDDYAARYGGEEFAIIFTDKNYEKAFEIAENIRVKFNKAIINGLEKEKFSVSGGISEHIKGMSVQEFFTNVDNAMYKAKRSGKNKVIIFEEPVE